MDDSTILAITVVAALVMAWRFMARLERCHTLQQIITDAAPDPRKPQFSDLQVENRILRYENSRLRHRLDELEEKSNVGIYDITFD